MLTVSIGPHPLQLEPWGRKNQNSPTYHFGGKWNDIHFLKIGCTIPLSRFWRSIKPFNSNEGSIAAENKAKLSVSFLWTFTLFEAFLS